ncbi:hypothetical protein WQ59_00485 [Streptomyces sp. KE1]|nr:hypothetical protein WQ59_00485 [Streptomyces sp. KE1]
MASSFAVAERSWCCLRRRHVDQCQMCSVVCRAALGQASDQASEFGEAERTRSTASTASTAWLTT